MIKRQRYLKALNNKKTDELVWAPNFDYWFDYNRSAGRLPEKYTADGDIITIEPGTLPR